MSIGSHPDTEALNTLASGVQDGIRERDPDYHVPFSTRHRIAAEFLAWLDVNRPGWTQEAR